MLVRKEAVGTALGVCFRRHAIGLSKQTRDWPFGTMLGRNMKPLSGKHFPIFSPLNSIKSIKLYEHH
jgi:hypothetical protein